MFYIIMSEQGKTESKYQINKNKIKIMKKKNNRLTIVIHNYYVCQSGITFRLSSQYAMHHTVNIIRI